MLLHGTTFRRLPRKKRFAHFLNIETSIIYSISICSSSSRWGAWQWIQPLTQFLPRYYEGAFAHGHHSSCRHYDWDMLLFWFFSKLQLKMCSATQILKDIGKSIELVYELSKNRQSKIKTADCFYNFFFYLFDRMTSHAFSREKQKTLAHNQRRRIPLLLSKQYLLVSIFRL